MGFLQELEAIIKMGHEEKTWGKLLLIFVFLVKIEVSTEQRISFSNIAGGSKRVSVFDVKRTYLESNPVQKQDEEEMVSEENTKLPEHDEEEPSGKHSMPATSGVKHTENVVKTRHSKFEMKKVLNKVQATVTARKTLFGKIKPSISKPNRD